MKTQSLMSGTETITVDGQALTRRYGYDATSNLTAMTDRNGRGRTFTYDGLNRQTQEQWLDEQGNPLRAQTLTYDAASQLTAASDPVSTYAYTYDLAGRLTSVNNAGTPGVPNVVLSYGYDAVNNLTAITDMINGIQAGTETLNYDALNRVTKMTQSGTGVAAKRVEMAYDAASQMTGLSRYSSLTGTQVIAGTSYAYDLAGRLTDLTHQRGAAVIADYGFTYDNANRLTQLTTPDGTSNYSYNDRYELTGSDHSYQGDEAYNYDATGNRTSYTTGDHNRLLSDGTYSYEYDNEGNRTRRVEVATGKATEYTWDLRNRLTSIVSKDGAGTITQTVLYAYDVYDRRLNSAIDADGAGAGAATEEHFVYDGSHIALVFDGAGNLTHRYFHGPQIDQVLAEETAGQTRWALGDHQGSVRDVINNTGTVLNHTTYDSFGQVTGESNPALDFRFGYTGRELDEESGLMQYRARYYDPAVGTFVGEDPLGFGAGDSNVYRYVFNSPTNYTDPSGMIAPLVVVAVVGAGAGVGIDFGIQYKQNDGNIAAINQWQLAINGLAGGLGGASGVGVGALTTRFGLQGIAGITSRTVLNSVISGAISGAATVANNIVDNLQDVACVPWDHRSFRGAVDSAVLGAAFAGGASLIGEGIEALGRSLRPQFYTLDGPMGSAQPVTRNSPERNLQNLRNQLLNQIESLDGALGSPQQVPRRLSDMMRRGGDTPDSLMGAGLEAFAIPASNIFSSLAGLTSGDSLPAELWRGDVNNNMS